MYTVDFINSSINLYKFFKTKYKGKELQTLIIKIFSISISSFYNWYYKYNNGLDFFKHPNKRKHKITNEIEKFIIEYIKLNPLTKIKKIKEIIKNNFGLSISKTSIYNVLKKNNITYKQTYKKINPYTDKQFKYKKTILKKQINKAKDNLISLDEMSIELNDIPPKGWNEKGKKCYIYSKNKSLKGKRYSLVMATSNKKILSYSIVEKGFKTPDFNNFIIENIQNNNLKKKTILMDNASIHKTKKLKRIIKKQNLSIIYGIPYHSEFNPIENVFSILRKKLQEKNVNNKKEIIDIVNKFIKEIKRTTLINIFNHSFKLLN